MLEALKFRLELPKEEKTETENTEQTPAVETVTLKTEEGAKDNNGQIAAPKSAAKAPEIKKAA
jgi:hypothetical protein